MFVLGIMFSISSKAKTNFKIEHSKFILIFFVLRLILFDRLGCSGHDGQSLLTIGLDYNFFFHFQRKLTLLHDRKRTIKIKFSP